MATEDRPVPKPRNNLPSLPKKNKSKQLSTDFDVICLSPSSVVYNKREPVVIVFNQSLPSNVEYTIKFTGMQTRNETSCPAQKIGDNVLTFRAPEHYPPEDVELSVHHGNHLTKLCSCKSFSFKSYLQKLRDTLVYVNDPIDFMCAALQLRQRNVVALDFELEKQFLKNTPPHFHLLANDGTQKMDERSSQDGDPTLLHFAARYNLIKLAIAILKCPGGYDALNISNSDGYNPSQIAEECGHDNLAFVLADAQQHHNITVESDDIYESMHDPVYDSYIKAVGRANDDDELYVPMQDLYNDNIYETMAQQEDVYQNSETFLSGYAAEKTFLSGYAAETTSLMSVSSTSSSESASSGASGPVDNRPRMPPPRHTQSCNEPAFREKLSGITREFKSFQERVPRKVSANQYSSVPRGTAPSATYREESPPPPPPPVRNPYIYQ